MPKYTFSGYRDDRTTVVAKDESTARHLAMVERWGTRTTLHDGTPCFNLPYAGWGLNLVDEQID